MGLAQKAVFPAYAGMFRTTSSRGRKLNSFPRIRGDVPGVAETCTVLFEFSPHTRGCSGNSPGLGDLRVVFPAYAGMFRGGPSGQEDCHGFPRIRGDVPNL